MILHTGTYLYSSRELHARVTALPNFHVAVIFGMIERRLVILEWASPTRSCIPDPYRRPILYKRYLSTGSSIRAGDLRSTPFRDFDFWPLRHSRQSSLPCPGPLIPLAERSLSVIVKKRRFGTGVVGEMADKTTKLLCS